MRTGPELIINADQLNLWSNIGKLNGKDFIMAYDAMIPIGLPLNLIT